MPDSRSTPDHMLPPSRDKDSRDIVTPYAFEVEERLIGNRIARPWRRGFAQIIDLLFIAVLSQLPSLILALLTAIAFLRASRRNNHKLQSSAAKRLLKFSGTLLLFIATVILVEAIRGASPPDPDDGPIAHNVAYGINLLGWNQCDDDFECLTRVADKAGAVFAGVKVTRDEVETHIQDFLDKSDLTDEQQALIKTRYLTAFDQAVAGTDTLSETHSGTASETRSEALTDSPATTSAEADSSTVKTTEAECNCSNTYLTLQWLQTLTADLGLGVGWAALYHSVFIAWFRGRTPGKKLLKIRVVKLDGSDFSLWDSFGRYGGYGAGFATGLLGFIQIYWDANRQAIQDKIAETVVIYEK